MFLTLYICQICIECTHSGGSPGKDRCCNSAQAPVYSMHAAQLVNGVRLLHDVPDFQVASADVGAVRVGCHMRQANRIHFVASE